ncbi:uncharacterized protein LOC120633811 isoform X1 [Pararge aegeria]|uniref:uncharacterized protein LOC120633811 isoform X1 n=1 Tax=Pararge aegeria TaxID=116150 RepID=UPI0019D1AB6F|nr:uncharacterized protein LOC120633811 isoform X1 [Pararge aegeria]
MKLLCGITLLALYNAVTSTPRMAGVARCANVWDEGCVSGQLQGAGRDDDFVSGDFSPGKRCAGAGGSACAGGARDSAEQCPAEDVHGEVMMMLMVSSVPSARQLGRPLPARPAARPA